MSWASFAATKAQRKKISLFFSLSDRIFAVVMSETLLQSYPNYKKLTGFTKRKFRIYVTSSLNHQLPGADHWQQSYKEPLQLDYRISLTCHKTQQYHGRQFNRNECNGSPKIPYSEVNLLTNYSQFLCFLSSQICWSQQEVDGIFVQIMMKNSRYIIEFTCFYVRLWWFPMRLLSETVSRTKSTMMTCLFLCSG